MDSIVRNSHDNYNDTPSSREQEAELIHSFISCAWKAGKGSSAATCTTLDENFWPVIYLKVPQQENGYDCGVVLLLFFQKCLEQKFPVREHMSGQILRWYNQASVTELREKIIDLLMHL